MSISIIRSCLLIKYSLISLHGIPKSHIFNPNWWEKVRDHWRKYHVTFHPTYHVTFHPMKSRGVRALCVIYGCTRHTFIFYLCSTAPLVYNNFEMDQLEKQNETILRYWRDQVINKKYPFKTNNMYDIDISEKVIKIMYF